MHLNQSFSSHSSFRVGFSADGALVREQRASLAKRYEKSVGTRMYHRHIKDFHKRNEVTIKNSVYHKCSPRIRFHLSIITFCLIRKGKQ